MLNITSKLPDPWWLVTFLGVFLYLPPVKAFNHAIMNDPNYAADQPNGFTVRQIVLILLGVAFWGLIGLGFYFGEPI